MFNCHNLRSERLNGVGSRSASFLLAVISLVILQASGLYLMGRPPVCACGSLRLWSGGVFSPQTSQQIADWYSFTHIEHGLILYFIGWFFIPGVGVLNRFLLAFTIEISWELLENTPWFVQLYRKQAVAIGYTGDSIINSISDAGFMAVGYVIAATAPTWASLALIAAIELLLLYSIRDCLALNILNFFHSFRFISRGQATLR